MSDERGLSAPQWQELYQRLEKPLYNFAWRYVWNAQEAEDIVHDAFLQVWERRDRILVATANRYLWVSVMNLAQEAALGTRQAVPAIRGLPARVVGAGQRRGRGLAA